jgi:UDP-3-O-[3-hydroxymyristoyl] N-acetylglucosamine deacetylase
MTSRRFTTSRRSADLQTTLARTATIVGIGAHGGEAARITLSPGDADTGVVFLRSGAHERPVAAKWRNVTSADLCVRVGDGPAAVATIEHLSAALRGLCVDNALIEIDGPEVPAMDGSAAAFVEAIDEAGVVALPARRRRLLMRAPVRVADGASWAELAPAADGEGFHLDVEIAFSCARIGRMRRAMRLTPASFRREIARARTFGFLADAERLWRSGLALGASLENTVVIGEDRILNPDGLRFADEYVRHKMLDVVGDIALIGAPIIGAFRSYRGGHRLNLALVEAVLATPSAFIEIGAESERRRDRVAAARPAAR